MTFNVIEMKAGNRMVRLGAGQHDGKWFIRVDLWWVGVRLATK